MYVVSYWFDSRIMYNVDAGLVGFGNGNGLGKGRSESDHGYSLGCWCTTSYCSL